MPPAAKPKPRPRTRSKKAASPNAHAGHPDGHAGHATRHDPAGTEKILARVRSIEGHLRAVANMVAEDAYCIDVLRQTKAIHGALARVDSLLLERHLGHCVSKAIRAGDTTERERVIAEILDVFEASKRS
jgi:DNA-binding FrmR family transcriptional regulator